MSGGDAFAPAVKTMAGYEVLLSTPWFQLSLSPPGPNRHVGVCVEGVDGIKRISSTPLFVLRDPEAMIRFLVASIKPLIADPTN